jgi:hypothetical protein
VTIAANVGLCIFVTAVVLDAGGLALDGVLYFMGLPTVTAAVMRNSWLGVPILALQVAALAGLALHFYGRR